MTPHKVEAPLKFALTHMMLLLMAVRANYPCAAWADVQELPTIASGLLNRRV
jgi:hypothetical protein